MHSLITHKRGYHFYIYELIHGLIISRIFGYLLDRIPMLNNFPTIIKSKEIHRHELVDGFIFVMLDLMGMQ